MTKTCYLLTLSGRLWPIRAVNAGQEAPFMIAQGGLLP